MFNSNLVHFATGRRDGKYVAQRDGSTVLSLPELIKGVTVSNTYAQNVGTTASDIIMDNLKQNGLRMAGIVIMTPILFSAAKKVLRKPILTPANRMLKTAGLYNTVRV